jgi:Fe-S-cluster containining protein
MLPAPECLACGTCCFSRLEEYVRVSGDYYTRLGERADELVRFDGNRAYMRMASGHCGALSVDSRSRQFFCGTYDTRPSICRELERGSGACHGEIEAKHLRPLLSLRRSVALEMRGIGKAHS